MSLATFLLFFHLAWRQSSLEIATLLSLFIIPLLGSRVEIRPEVFSYFFIGLFLWILVHATRFGLPRRWLFALPLLEIAWVNLHIYFPFGVALVALFAGEHGIKALILKKQELWIRTKTLLFMSGLTALVALLNPRGITGVLYPFRIFGNYGYRLFENQSVWFIERILAYPPALYFKIAFGILIASSIAGLWQVLRNRRAPSPEKTSAAPLAERFPIAYLILTAVASVMAWRAVRNFTLFGYLALPLAAANLTLLFPQRRERNGRYYFGVIIISLLLFSAIILINPAYWDARKNPGLGLMPGVKRSAAFFREQNIEGPILNNYDNGGYLIYYLYPRPRVFVDNRPEAYPASFFQNLYVPLQENEEVWKKKNEEYRFNVIFFYRHDLTPWAQSFLARRVNDPDWAPVYVDDYHIIFLKRGGPNQNVIERYELPKSMFSVRPAV